MRKLVNLPMNENQKKIRGITLLIIFSVMLFAAYRNWQRISIDTDHFGSTSKWISWALGTVLYTLEYLMSPLMLFSLGLLCYFFWRARSAAPKESKSNAKEGAEIDG